jgi:hypothetical protein
MMRGLNSASRYRDLRGVLIVAQSTTLVNSPEKTQDGGSQVPDRIDVPDFWASRFTV